MSETETSQENSEIIPETPENIEENKIEIKETKRSDLTKKELAAIAKQRAIENFNNGVIDPEYKVTKMKNGKFRCTKRKTDLPPEPIKQDQIPDNVKSSEKTIEKTEKVKSKEKVHDPFSDIVYFNMTNQVNEQLNKRLDLLNSQIEKLSSKNSKLKGKYKQLKQAIFVSEDEEEPTNPEPVNPEPVEPAKNEPVEPAQPPSQIPRRRTTGINFNQFFR